MDKRLIFYNVLASYTITTPPLSQILNKTNFPSLVNSTCAAVFPGDGAMVLTISNSDLSIICIFLY